MNETSAFHVEAPAAVGADAAHELRTPIAAIRTHAQVALGESDDALRRHGLLATLEGCDRATRLVEQLLALSRLDAGAMPPALTPLDLSALVRNVVADVAPQAIDKHHTIEVDTPGPCPVQGDATLVAMLLRNLVDNAVRYTPPHGIVRVAVTKHPAHVRLTVEDSGPGMSEQDIERLGERFFRVLGSGETGSGLGWSIVRRIADVHDVAVRIGRSDSLGGLAVEVDWPAGS